MSKELYGKMIQQIMPDDGLIQSTANKMRENISKPKKTQLHRYAVLTACAAFLLIACAVIYGEMRPHVEIPPYVFYNPANNTGIQTISFKSNTGESIEAVFVTLHSDDIASYMSSEWDDKTIAERNVLWIKRLQETEGVQLISNYVCVAFYEPGALLRDTEELRELFSKSKAYNIDGYIVSVLRISV